MIESTTREGRVGVLLVLLSAAAFGSMAVLAKLAYREGLEPVGLLALRFSLAALGMWLVWLYHYKKGERAVVSRRALLPLVAMGALGYVGQSFSYFSAAERIPASATALLLYTYPTMVVVLDRIFFGGKLTAAKLCALALSAAGTLLVLGLFSALLLPGGGAGFGALNTAGVLFGLSAAAIYSAYIIAGTRFATSAHASFSSAVVISSAACVYLPVAWLGGNLARPISPVGLGWAAAIALICTVVAISAFFAGLKIVGPSRASIISTVEPAVTVTLAALALGESISFEQIIGGALIIAALVLLQVEGSRARRPAPIDTARQTS